MQAGGYNIAVNFSLIKNGSMKKITNSDTMTIDLEREKWDSITDANFHCW